MHKYFVFLIILLAITWQSDSMAQQLDKDSFIKLFNKGPWEDGAVLDFAVSTSGQVYVVTFDKQIFKLAFDDWRKIRINNVANVKGIILGSNDKLFLYNDKGVYEDSAEGWVLNAINLDLPEGSRIYFVRLASANEMVFQYTNRVKCGLISLQNNQWKKITAFEDYQFASTISGFEFSKDGSAYMGMRDAEGVYKIDDTGLKKINDKTKDPVYSVKGLKIDDKDDIYVALDYSLSSYHDPTRPQLMQFDGKNWKESGPRHNGSNLPVKISTIVRDSKGIIYLGTPSGLFFLKAGQWDQYSFDDQNDPGSIYKCVVDRSDIVWCICDSGLLMITP